MRRFISLLGLGTLLPVPLWAQQCSVDPLMEYTQLGGDAFDQQIHVEADASESDFLTADFEGEVKVRQGNKHLFAPSLHYDRNAARITGKEGVTFGSPKVAIKGEGGEYKLEEDLVYFERAEYYLSPKTEKSGDNGANGYADKAEFNRTTHIDKMENVTWSTCERTNPIWQLKARGLTLDHNTNLGVARDMTFRIGDVPVFWSPYFSFPITNERMTGFLVPSASSSDERGLEAIIPFYWNIAPNQDATFTFHPMTKRGVMLEGEYRFMTEKQYGVFDAGILSSDRAYNHENRWRIGVDYRYQFNPQWRADFHYQNVSDIDYLEDIGSGLDLYDDWYLERYARLSGKGDWGNLIVNVQDYERVSPNVKESSKPYSRLPQIIYHKQWQENNFKWGIKAEATKFHKTGVGDAGRFGFSTDASYRLEQSYGFLEPKVSLSARHYHFDPLHYKFREGSKTQFVPTVSLDGGLIFERDFEFAGQSYTQTLEPRLFYLYTPYKDQSDIPNFDTSALSKSWSWLFARNRFTGGDKIGDANQLTTAVTTRLYRNSDGQEKLRLSLGQIRYLKDREVGLTRNTKIEENKSVIVSEGNYQIDRHWSLYGLSFWNPNEHRNERDVVDLNYKLDEDRYVHIGHRYKENSYDQFSIGGGWRVSSNWRLFARHDHSFRHNQPFNTMLGVEYEDCCWAWRLVGKHYRNEPEDKDKHNAVYLEFIFKGIGNMGNRSGNILHEQLNNFKPLPQERKL